MIKLYDDTKLYIKNLSYSSAFDWLSSGFYITRLEWDGFHFKKKGKYYILQKNRTILVSPNEIYDIDKHDWCVVDITMEAVEIIKGLED